VPVVIDAWMQHPTRRFDENARRVFGLGDRAPAAETVG
jgi:hypothetical protein